MEKQKAIRLQDLIKRDRRSLKLMMDAGEMVIARNKSTGKVRSIPVRALYQNNPQFYRVVGGSYDYLIPADKAKSVMERLKEIDESVQNRRSRSGESETSHNNYTVDGDSSPTAEEGGKPSAKEPSTATERAPAAAAPATDTPPNFGDAYDRVAQLEKEERLSLLKKAKEQLKELAQNSEATAEQVNELLVSTTTDAALTNKTTIQEALRMGNEEARKYTTDMVEATQEMLRSTALLVDHELYNEDLISQVVERSNGTVVQHMTRVFLTGFAFMLYYNRQILTSSLANKLRIHFEKRYKKYYRRLLPHLHEDYVNLEHVFYGGIKALSDLEINRFATGFLVHDVGKAEDIEYHEGEAGYDRETVVRHVKLGYKAVMNKTTYPREAALITGYHHEYYGDPAGYGYFREFLQAYKNMKPDAKIDYLISYEMEPLIDYEVLAYFPAKMLEVVDVFDSLTDPNRKYRSPLSAEEAIGVLRNQFVEEKLKVDPIILDLYIQFLQERGILAT